MISASKPTFVHQLILDTLYRDDQKSMGKKIQESVGALGHMFSLNAVGSTKAIQKLVSISNEMMGNDDERHSTGLDRVEEWVGSEISSMEEYEKTVRDVMKDMDEVARDLTLADNA